VASHVDEADVQEDAKMLGDRRLGHPQRDRDLADRTLAGGEVFQDVATAGFCNRVECIRGRGGARHHPIIFS
jgi:hypothetical protein